MTSRESPPSGATALQGAEPRELIQTATPRHYLTGVELSAAELDGLLTRAAELKAAPLSSCALAGRSVALIFEKPSTRTRVSFEVGIHELGGHAVVLRADELQLSRGEARRDTALVLSRHVAAVGLRTGADDALEELAAYSTVPVLNMLSARHHPCQALADLLTLREAYGALQGLRLAYVGDGNNVARSLAILGTLAGMHVAIASPAGYALEPDLGLHAGAGARLTLHSDPYEAVQGACAVYTDVWVSMGDEATARERRDALADYRIDDVLLDAAAPGAFAMHDLPAHPGEEITAEVMYGPRQRIWEQAENRRHAQKALLELLIAGEADRAGSTEVDPRGIPADLA
jgi:ornithine carbamoyltransferase